METRAKAMGVCTPPPLTPRDQRLPTVCTTLYLCVSLSAADVLCAKRTTVFVENVSPQSASITQTMVTSGRGTLSLSMLSRSRWSVRVVLCYAVAIFPADCLKEIAESYRLLGHLVPQSSRLRAEQRKAPSASRPTDEEDKVDTREQTETEDDVFSGDDAEIDDLEKEDDDYHADAETTRGEGLRKGGAEYGRGEMEKKTGSKAQRKTQAGGGQRQGTHQRKVKAEDTAASVRADVSAVYPLPSLHLELDKKRKAADRESQKDGGGGGACYPSQKPL